MRRLRRASSLRRPASTLPDIPPPGTGISRRGFLARGGALFAVILSGSWMQWRGRRVRDGWLLREDDT